LENYSVFEIGAHGDGYSANHYSKKYAHLIYTGELDKDLNYHGEGEMYYENGALKCDGLWKTGSPLKGSFYNESKVLVCSYDLKHSTLIKGELKGYGTFVVAGERYLGDIKNGIPEGLCRKIDYKDDYLSGIIFFLDGLEIEMWTLSSFIEEAIDDTFLKKIVEKHDVNFVKTKDERKFLRNWQIFNVVSLDDIPAVANAFDTDHLVKYIWCISLVWIVFSPTSFFFFFLHKAWKLFTEEEYAKLETEDERQEIKKYRQAVLFHHRNIYVFSDFKTACDSLKKKDYLGSTSFCYDGSMLKDLVVTDPPRVTETGNDTVIDQPHVTEIDQPHVTETGNETGSDNEESTESAISSKKRKADDMFEVSRENYLEYQEWKRLRDQDSNKSQSSSAIPVNQMTHQKGATSETEGGTPKCSFCRDLLTEIEDSASEDTKGTYIFPDKSFYTGNLVHGVPNGHGTCFYPYGSVYVGRWKDGKRNGEGELNTFHNSVYKGEWKNDKEHGIFKVSMWLERVNKLVEFENGEKV
jgi:hypothetical protein